MSITMALQMMDVYSSGPRRKMAFSEQNPLCFFFFFFFFFSCCITPHFLPPALATSASSSCTCALLLHALCFVSAEVGKHYTKPHHPSHPSSRLFFFFCSLFFFFVIKIEKVLHPVRFFLFGEVLSPLRADLFVCLPGMSRCSLACLLACAVNAFLLLLVHCICFGRSRVSMRCFARLMMCFTACLSACLPACDAAFMCCCCCYCYHCHLFCARMRSCRCHCHYRCPVACYCCCCCCCCCCCRNLRLRTEGKGRRGLFRWPELKKLIAGHCSSEGPTYSA
ncbi:hypothetical protein IWX90DRAFT_130810 [Phyllosticta citrichinensis]|uniref:Uncharacterized protein n=1 Tax=Phyllosticta citrichinensis TaxID=1130410 RepID=A0ABR1Y4U8_9PEZI